MEILVLANLVVLVVVVVGVGLFLHHTARNFDRLRSEQDHTGGQLVSNSERVAAMGQSLENLGLMVNNLSRDGAAKHGELIESITHTVRSTEALQSTTNALSAALTNSQVRGQWGERMAEDVLVAAGFQEGINYRRADRVSSGGVPDFTFLLPQGSVVHMDVKFPIDNYLRLGDAVTESEREGFEKAFLKDVRNRIKELDGRGYMEQPEVVDCVLVFIPNEAVYSFVASTDPEIFDFAARHRAVLCSPNTLFGVLAVLRQATQNFNLEQTSAEILEHLGAFEDEWRRYTAEIDKVTKQFATASGTLESLNSTRRRKLEKRFDAIDQLRTSTEVDAVTAAHLHVLPKAAGDL